MSKQIALLHPGEMGVTVGVCAKTAGHEVGWVASGRSEATRRRADTAGLVAFPSLDGLLDSSDMVISICPPSAAKTTAAMVAELGYHGLYVDANAISPRTAATVAKTVAATGATYVDGGIIGPPAREAGRTRLYLSGARAADVAACFSGTRLQAIDIGESPSAASALKMCYAAWTKGSAALLLAVGALARAEHVESALRAEWARSLPDLARRLETSAAGNAAKAWRFEGEMHEIADTFEANALPGDFHRAAAETFALLNEYKGVAGKLNSCSKRSIN
jgi:3-hydroxyisobutyrate dehydrogenase-like beta-hydroxyacid dehydrogenase